MAAVARMGCCISLPYATTGASMKIVGTGLPNALSKAVGTESTADHLNRPDELLGYLAVQD